MGNAEALEVVFGLLAVLGLIFSYLNIRDTTSDLAAMRGLGIRNGRHFVAKHLLLAESVRAGIQLIHLAIAIMAGALAASPPSPPGLPLKVVVTNYLITYGLILSAAMVGVLSAHAWWWRRAFPAVPQVTPDGAVLASIDESLGRLADRADEAEDRRVENPHGDLDIARDHNGE